MFINFYWFFHFERLIVKQKLWNFTFLVFTYLDPDPHPDPYEHYLDPGSGSAWKLMWIRNTAFPPTELRITPMICQILQFDPKPKLSKSRHWFGSDTLYIPHTWMVISRWPGSLAFLVIWLKNGRKAIIIKIRISKVKSKF